MVQRVLGTHRTSGVATRVDRRGEGRGELARLVRRDARWRLLHRVPVGEWGSDIDHVVIGPAGVFTLNAKHHPGKRIWVRGDAFLVGGSSHPYVRNSPHEAARASRLLSAAIARPCRRRESSFRSVRRISRSEVPQDVHVVPRRQIAQWLAAWPHAMNEPMIARAYDVARRSTIWTARRAAPTPPGSDGSHRRDEAAGRSEWRWLDAGRARVGGRGLSERLSVPGSDINYATQPHEPCTCRPCGAAPQGDTGSGREVRQLSHGRSRCSRREDKAAAGGTETTRKGPAQPGELYAQSCPYLWKGAHQDLDDLLAPCRSSCIDWLTLPGFARLGDPYVSSSHSAAIRFECAVADSDRLVDGVPTDADSLELADQCHDPCSTDRGRRRQSTQRFSRPHPVSGRGRAWRPRIALLLRSGRQDGGSVGRLRHPESARRRLPHLYLRLRRCPGPAHPAAGRRAAGQRGRWPDPWLSLNPSFDTGGSIAELVHGGLRHPECERIFRVKNDPASPGARVLTLHRHQRDATRSRSRARATRSPREPGPAIARVHRADRARRPQRAEAARA